MICRESSRNAIGGIGKKTAAATGDGSPPQPNRLREYGVFRATNIPLTDEVLVNTKMVRASASGRMEIPNCGVTSLTGTGASPDLAPIFVAAARLQSVRLAGLNFSFVVLVVL